MFSYEEEIYTFIHHLDRMYRQKHSKDRRNTVVLNFRGEAAEQ